MVVARNRYQKSLRQQFDALKRQKKRLMQKRLTGQIRLRLPKEGRNG
jgi:hypothetical protein